MPYSVGVSFGYWGAAGERYAKVELKYYYFNTSNTYWYKYRAVYRNGKWYYYSYNTNKKELIYGI